MTEDERRLEAARIVAQCKPSKLPYVLSILRQGGFEVDEVAIGQSRKNIRDRKDWLVRYRSENQSKSWEKTDDPDVLLLRKAFADGASLAKIASVADLNTSTVYKFMYDQRKPTDFVRQRVLYGLKEAYGIEP